MSEPYYDQVGHWQIEVQDTWFRVWSPDYPREDWSGHGTSFPDALACAEARARRLILKHPETGGSHDHP